jgi:hypothetical protein
LRKRGKPPGKHGKTCKNMGKHWMTKFFFGKTWKKHWENMGKHWENMQKHEKHGKTIKTFGNIE